MSTTFPSHLGNYRGKRSPAPRFNGGQPLTATERRQLLTMPPPARQTIFAPFGALVAWASAKLRVKAQILVPLLVLAAMLLTGGCIGNNTGTGPTTQPVVAFDPQAAKFFAELAIDDAVLLAANDPKLAPYIDAAQKAKADLETADPAVPQYQKYIKAANDAALTLVLESRKAKAAKAVGRAAALIVPAWL